MDLMQAVYTKRLAQFVVYKEYIECTIYQLKCTVHSIVGSVVGRVKPPALLPATITAGEVAQLYTVHSLGLDVYNQVQLYTCRVLDNETSCCNIFQSYTRSLQYIVDQFFVILHHIKKVSDSPYFTPLHNTIYMIISLTVMMCFTT